MFNGLIVLPDSISDLQKVQWILGLGSDPIHHWSRSHPIDILEVEVGQRELVITATYWLKELISTNPNTNCKAAKYVHFSLVAFLLNWFWNCFKPSVLTVMGYLPVLWRTAGFLTIQAHWGHYVLAANSGDLYLFNTKKTTNYWILRETYQHIENTQKRCN